MRAATIFAIAALAPFGLNAAAADAEDEAEKDPYTLEDMVEMSVSSGYALVLAEKCPMIDYLADRGEALIKDMLTDLNEAGLDNTTIGEQIVELGRQTPEDTERFMDAEGIVFQEQETWCDAAFRHIRDDSRIGMFLFVGSVAE
jgi:hypothetical protein